MKRVICTLICIIAIFFVITTVVAQNLQVSKKTQDSEVQVSEKYVVKDRNPDIPHEISYQGYLEEDGVALTGTYNMNFGIYVSSAGGTACWSHTYSVEVTNGRFSVVLGSEGAPIPSSCFTGTERYLQIIIEGTTLTPRTKLTSIGYTYVSELSDNADKLDGHDSGHSSGDIPINDGAVCTNLNADMLDGHHWSEVTTGYWTQVGSALYPNDSDWRVGIGTTSPNTDYILEVRNGRVNIDGSSSSKLVRIDQDGSGNALEIDGAGDTGIDIDNVDIGIYVDAYNTGGEFKSSNATPVVSRAYNTSYASLYGRHHNSGSGTGIVGLGGGVSNWNGYSSTGVAGFGNNFGIVGVGGQFGGMFTDGNAIVYVATTLSGTEYKIYGDGNVSCIMPTRQGKKVLFAPECPEPYFEDFGEGQLVNGHTHIDLDPLFEDCIKTDSEHPLKVFIQLNDNCNGVYVKTGTSGFDVYELQGGISNASFTYRVVGNRNDTDYLRFPDAFEIDKEGMIQGKP
ncbi:MAG: hypothetical protein H8D22_08915 [Candidatus Cloacimonetes bacterium]|nr:hypothetical protein [Candidatus Cloacimonadota bacterium]